MIYSDTSREYRHTANLRAYANYSFVYEACTSVGCTRSARASRVATFESAPGEQPTPRAQRLASTSCFRIEWTPPVERNGRLTAFRLYRATSDFNGVDEDDTDDDDAVSGNITNIANFSDSSSPPLSAAAAVADKFSFVDCDLQEHLRYAYRVVAVNREGESASAFSERVFLSQPLPAGFVGALLARQLNASAFELTWNAPLHPNGRVLAYKLQLLVPVVTDIYLSSDLINQSSSGTLTYLHALSGFIVPNTLYRFQLFACNEAGCATDHVNATASIMR